MSSPEQQQQQQQLPQQPLSAARPTTTAAAADHEATPSAAARSSGLQLLGSQVTHDAYGQVGIVPETEPEQVLLQPEPSAAPLASDRAQPQQPQPQRQQPGSRPVIGSWDDDEELQDLLLTEQEQLLDAVMRDAEPAAPSPTARHDSPSAFERGGASPTRAAAGPAPQPAPPPPQQQQRQRPPAPPHRAAGIGSWDDDEELQDLLLDEQEQQQHQQAGAPPAAAAPQQQQRHDLAAAQAAAAAWGCGLDLDDPADALLAEVSPWDPLLPAWPLSSQEWAALDDSRAQQVLEIAQDEAAAGADHIDAGLLARRAAQLEGRRTAINPALARPAASAAAGAATATAAGTSMAGGRPVTTAASRHSAGAAAAAAAAAGGAGAFDLGDELDALFADDDDDSQAGLLPAGDDEDAFAAGPSPSRSQAALRPAPKPATLTALGAGGLAAPESRRAAAAAALAALQAAAQRPQALASRVRGRAITITGSTGQRVYCELGAAAQPGGAAAVASGGGRGPGAAVGSLLPQPIDDLLEELAERRRHEVIAEVMEAQAAADAASAAADAAADELERAMRGEDDEAARGQGSPTGAAAAQQQRGRGSSSPGSGPAAAAAAPPVARQLWVDKYAPRSFLSLLSDPRINREIATWVAAWKNRRGGGGGGSADGQQHQQRQPPQQQQQQHGGGRGQGRGGGGVGRGGPGGRGGRGGSGGGPDSGQQQQQQQQRGISRAFDIARYQAAQAARSAARVLLIVGPPGSCKTSLAHVIARHCGFRVVEINASDERNATALTRAVTDAAEMAPVLDGERRPPCIVLDELDGAAGGSDGHSAVAALVRLLTGEGRGGGRQRRGGGKRGGGSGLGGGGLGVPVICTANDAFAPCLRPLKEVAAVYYFKPPAPDKLAGRLAAIAAAEGLGVDKQALALLVERSGCDVRTAINTLQLLARQQKQQQHGGSPGQQPATQRAGGAGGSGSRRVITAAAVAGSGAFGLKDVAAGPLALLQELLTASASRGMSSRLQRLAAALRTEQQQAGGSGRRQPGLTATTAARLQLQEHFNMLLDLAEHEQVMLALHEALPGLIGLDVDLANSLAAAAALSDADVLMRGGRSAGGGPGRQYVPACLLTVVGLLRRDAAGVGVLGGAGGLQLTWPRAQAECNRATAANCALLRSWRASAPAAASRVLSTASECACELAPALKDLSRPAAVRGINQALLSAPEGAVLGHVVEALVAYGLTYTFDEEDEPEASAAGGLPPPPQRPAPLAPAIDGLHRYAGLPQLVARSAGGGGGAGAAAGSTAAPLRPGWSRGAVPLVLRQTMARLISAAVIRRLEHARNAGAEAVDGQQQQQPGGAPGAAAAGGPSAAFAAARQAQAQIAAARARALAGGSGSGAAKKKRAGAGADGGATGAAAPRGCWLDALKVQAAAKRKAAVLGHAGAASKRAAVQQQGGAGDAAGGDGAEAGAADEHHAGGGGGGAGHHTVLFRFNEGYTNAVKRPLRMGELLAPAGHNRP